jgi:hypothetical protein
VTRNGTRDPPESPKAIRIGVVLFDAVEEPHAARTAAVTASMAILRTTRRVRE